MHSPSPVQVLLVRLGLVRTMGSAMWSQGRSTMGGNGEGHNDNSNTAQESTSTANMRGSSGLMLLDEIWISTDLLFQSRLTWLLVFGPIALFGDATGVLGEAVCFAFSGIALIPCAERLSFVTEQVAAHTNGTIGALLNATFGNAPELLISTAALRSGFYRVVQLAMLGSMLTNLLFVFGVSCLVGGLRWQVQELRITSGNINIVMLLVATAGSLLPAALAMSGQMKQEDQAEEQRGLPSRGELAFCRVNAAVMVILYMCYLLFQLGTHKEEFDEDENIVETPDHLLLMTPHYTSRHGRKKRAERNRFCLWWFGQANIAESAPTNDIELTRFGESPRSAEEEGLVAAGETSDISSNEDEESQNHEASQIAEWKSDTSSLPETRRRNNRKHAGNSYSPVMVMADSVSLDGALDKKDKLVFPPQQPAKRKQSGGPGGDVPENGFSAPPVQQVASTVSTHHEPQMSFRIGIVWLFIITLCISAMSDILVDTIDGFAHRCHLSEVFTSMVIVPFFSNVAEQVSAILFAYRNEMDLCVGVTVGSAIQIASFVLPGCVLIGMLVDRSMTLYFRGYETCCLFFGVVCVASILQGGTTNWLVGTGLIGIYCMIAAGFWFHEIEDLSTDAELIFRNDTNSRL